MSMQDLTDTQKQKFEMDIMRVLNSPRWFVLPGNFDPDCKTPPHEVGPAENRDKGLSDPIIKKQFEDELSHAVSAKAWMVVYGTLSDEERLRTEVFVQHLNHDRQTHQILERFVFEALKRGCAWTWRMPIKRGDEPNEGLFRHIAHGAYEALERRSTILPSGVILGRGDWKDMIMNQMPAQQQQAEPAPVFRPPPGKKRRARPGWWKKR